MKLNIAEIEALKNRINDLGGYNAGTLHLQRKLEELRRQDARTIEGLLPSAIKLITYRFEHSNNSKVARFRYKISGYEVVVVHRKEDSYALYVNRHLVMVFGDIESLARFLIVSEDIVMEYYLEE